MIGDILFNYVIESKNNKIVKLIQSLKNKKNRDKHKLFIAEGERFIYDIDNIKDIDFIVVSENYDINKIKFDCKKYILSESIFKNCCNTENPQGILAICKQKNYNLSYIENIVSNFGSSGFYIIIDKINNPGNLGTIIRSADAGNVNAIFISNDSVDLYNDKVLRATMGSIFHIDIFQNCDIKKIIGILSKNNVSIYATSLEANKYPYDIDLKKGSAFVIGNEAIGVSKEVISLCNEKIKLPIIGKAESLNVSVAAGILIYEVVRQRIL